MEIITEIPRAQKAAGVPGKKIVTQGNFSPRVRNPNRDNRKATSTRKDLLMRNLAKRSEKPFLGKTEKKEPSQKNSCLGTQGKEKQ